MKTTPFHTPHSIEILEDRIAPAGVVSVAYTEATGELTLTGDAAGNVVSVFETAPGQHRVTGSNGTTLTGGVTAIDIGKLTKLTIDAGDGADQFNLTNLLTLTSLSFDGEGGLDIFASLNLTVKGPVNITGGAGADLVTFAGLATLVTGDFQVQDSADGIDVFLDAAKTVIGGRVIFDGSSGLDTLQAGTFGNGAGSLSIAKGIDFDAGAGSGFLIFDNKGGTTIGKLPTGESILFTGGTGVDFIRGGGVGYTFTGGIRMTGGTGSDSIAFTNFDSTTKLGKLASGHSILFDGGSDGDVLTLFGSRFTMAGGIEFLAGDGDNNMFLGSTLGSAGAIVTIGKLATGESLKYVGGPLSDTITSDVAKLTLAGGLTFEGGAGTNRLDLDGPNGTVKLGKLASGESIRYDGGNDDDSFTSNAAIFTAAGGVRFEGRSGENEIDFDGSASRITLGKLKTGQSIDYTGGPNDDLFECDQAIVTMAGGIEMNGGKGINELSLDGDGIVRLGTIAGGQSIKLLSTGGAGTNTSDIFVGGKSVALKGSVELFGEADNTIDFDGVTVTVGKTAAGDSLVLDGGGGEDLVNLTELANATFLGKVRLLGGNGADALIVDDTTRFKVNGEVFFDGGAGDDELFMDAFSLTLGNKLTFLGGDGTDVATVNAEGSIAGDVLLDLGAATSGAQFAKLISRHGLRSGLSMKGALNISSAGDAASSDALTITNVAVARAIDVNLGPATALVLIDNLVAGDVLNMATGDGNDQVFIERNDFAGNSIIAKLATIQTGLGDDTVLISRATPAPNGGPADSTRVRFLGGLNADGGDLLNDTRNDFNAENDFPLGPTVPANFEIVA